jgi:hypothetical protein
MSRPWTNEELRLLGTQPDAEVGRLIGRPGKAVWAKRKAPGIAEAPSLVRHWTDDEDRVVLSQPVADAARSLHRTVMAIRIRRRKLLRACQPEAAPKLLSLEEARLHIEVPKYDSKEQEERVRFVGGPYAPPRVAIGGWLKCALRGDLQVGGYTNAMVPWPVAAGHHKQLIVCGDLVKALRTESRLAAAFHFGISLALVSEYRSRLNIERFTAGSQRLFWRSVNLARTPEARRKLSRKLEGRGDTMTPEAREELRRIQQQPKSQEWKARMSERWSRRFALLGPPRPWTEDELKLIGTKPDREVARLLDRSLSAVKAKKFQLRSRRGHRTSDPTRPPVSAPAQKPADAVARSERSEAVTAPGVPPDYPESAKLVTENCIAVPEGGQPR